MIYISPFLNAKYEQDDKNYNLDTLINRKNYTKADTRLSYRQINTLSKDNLFPEDRDNKKGWRKFSHKDLIYLSIVYELKKFSLPHDILRNLADSFFKEPVPNGKLQTNKYTSDVAIGCVLVRAEIILTIMGDGTVTYYDPAHYLLIGLDNTPAIQLRLNDVVNAVNKQIGQKTINYTWSIKNYLWNKGQIKVSPSEKEVIEVIRNNDYFTVKVKKTDGHISIIQAEKDINTNKLTQREILNLLNAKDFQDVKILKRDGNIVSFKIAENIKLNS